MCHITHAKGGLELLDSRCVIACKHRVNVCNDSLNICGTILGHALSNGFEVLPKVAVTGSVMEGQYGLEITYMIASTTAEEA